MQSKEFKDIIFMRLFEGEDLQEQIKKACKIYDVKTAVIVSGIGQIRNTKLGYFKSKGDYSPDSFNKPLEILSLSGNICKKDEDYIPHIHIVLGDEKKKAFGGHLIEGKISVTGEITILKTKIDAKRKLDKKTGLEALYLE